MKKLLIINSFYHPDIVGGAEISTMLLAEGLTKYYDVYVIVAGSHSTNIKREVINNVTIFRIPCLNIYSPLKGNKKNNILKLLWHLVNLFNPYQYYLLRKLIKGIQPDIIHTQNLMGIGTYVWGIGKKMKIPIAHTTRDYALIHPVNNRIFNRLLLLINRKRSEKVDIVIGISMFILQKHKKEKIFSNVKSEVIGNVVDAKRYERKEIVKNEGLTIGYFGQLKKSKGIYTLLQAIEGLNSNIIKKVIICGTGELSEEVSKISKLDKRINFKGKLKPEEVLEQMAKIDLTIVPSIWDEPFGRVIIESYYQGTPVIASNVGGIPEIVENSNMLFEKENVDELSNKIIFFRNLEIKENIQLINDSYNKAEKYKDNIKQYLEVYNNLIK